MFEQKSVKVPPGDSGFFGGRRDVAATLAKEPKDRLTLEFADEPFLASEEPVVGWTRQAPRFLQMKGQVLGLDRPIAGQDDGPLDDVLELTEVPRPRIPFEQIQGLRRNPLDLLVDLGFGFPEEVV